MKQDDDPSGKNSIPDGLDGALAFAYGAGQSVGPQISVIQRIRAVTGRDPSISLREGTTDDSPMLKPLGAGSARQAGKYVVHGELGRGGVGTVMRGHDTDLGRDVAMKFLHEDFADEPTILQRFVEEAQIGGQLQHPGIVPVYDLGLRDDKPYFTMKLVKGETLAKTLAEREQVTDDRHRMLSVFEDVCLTMAYAHARGVVHRDLKPANIMIGAFGEVQVVDWGMSKVLHGGGIADEELAEERRSRLSIIETVRSSGHGSRSLVGSVMGTPSFMPPEQARGEVEAMDERSDVFALGAILCEVLTGAPPYTGKQALEKAAAADLADAHRRLDGCGAPADLVELVTRCMAPAPSARPRNAKVVAEAIATHRAGLEDRARQSELDATEARVRAVEERKARRLTLGLAAAALVILSLSGGGWWWVDRAARERNTETATRVAHELTEARRAQVQRDWPVVRAALARAEAIVASSDAPEALRASVQDTAEEIRDDEAAAERVARQAAANLALIERLQDLRRPEGDQFYRAEWEELDASYRRAFEEEGIRVLEDEPSHVADLLEARGLGANLAPYLDDWTWVAEHAADAGHSDTAARVRSIATQIDPDARRGRLRRAMMTGDLAALQELVDEMEGQPAPTALLLALALKQEDQVDTATSVLRQAVRENPQDFMLQMSLAQTLTHGDNEEMEESLRHFHAALALRPNSREAHHGLASALSRLGRRQEAIDQLRVSTARFPEDRHLLSHMIWPLMALDDRAGAMEVCRKSVAIQLGERETARSLIELAQAQSMLRMLDEARATTERLVNTYPNDAGVWSTRARQLRADGDVEGALSALRRSVELEPEAPQYHEELGKMLARSGDQQGAIAAYRRALEVDPDYSRASSALASILIGTGDVEAGKAVLEAALARNPREVKGFADVALTLSSREEATPDEIALALRFARLAYEKEPHEEFVQLAMLGTLFFASEFEECIVLGKRFLPKKQSSKAAIDMFLALAHARLGNLEQALEHYRESEEMIELMNEESPFASLVAELQEQLGVGK